MNETMTSRTLLSPSRIQPTRPALTAGIGPWVWVLIGAIAMLTFACQDTQRRDIVSGPGSRAVAVVNNERIGFEEFQNAYQLFLTRWDRFFGNDPEKKLQFREIILDMMIDEKLMDQEARRRGIEVSDGELEKVAFLANTTPQEWRRLIKRNMVHDKLLAADVIGKISVSRREMTAYYERHKQEFFQAEQVRVRHIAVGSRSLHTKIIRLLQRKRKFGTLVEKYSITPDRLAGGELGFVERGVLPPEFDQAIFKLKKVGSISPARAPVQTQIGYHIFQLQGRRTEGQLPLEEALPRIRQILTEQKQPVAFRTWLQALRNKAAIKINKKLLHADAG